jgi:hypothetical protein
MLNFKFEELLNNYLQYYIKIYTSTDLNNLPYTQLREGKLVNINCKTPYVTLKLEYNNKIREFHYPIPFNYSINNNNIIFDYTLSQLCKNDAYLIDKIYKLPYDCENPIYNGYIIINTTNEQQFN